MIGSACCGLCQVSFRAQQWAAVSAPPEDNHSLRLLRCDCAGDRDCEGGSLYKNRWGSIAASVIDH